MQTIKFKECNVTYGAHQPEYYPMDGCRVPGCEFGRVVFCWKLSWRDRLKLLLRGVVWHEVCTFGGRLQPQNLSFDKPQLLPHEIPATVKLSEE